jgi:hypothetical protein
MDEQRADNISRDAIVAHVKEYIMECVEKKMNDGNYWWLDDWMEECFDSYMQQQHPC